MNPKAVMTALGLIVGAVPVAGNANTFTTVDVSSYLNNNQSINPQSVPTGTTTGNQGTGIPFAITPNSSEQTSWLASNSSNGVLDISVNVSGQASFYALLNNYFGTLRANEYDITIKASNGDSVTYQSIGGVDTRDHNSNVFTNTIANTTTFWFDNGMGQRLDVREFTLPANFASDTITDFIITQVDSNDPALLTGLTFSGQPAVVFGAVPEPSTWAIILGFMAYRRKQNGTALRLA